MKKFQEILKTDSFPGSYILTFSCSTHNFLQRIFTSAVCPSTYILFCFFLFSIFDQSSHYLYCCQVSPQANLLHKWVTTNYRFDIYFQDLRKTILTGLYILFLWIPCKNRYSEINKERVLNENKREKVLARTGTNCSDK